MLPNCLSLIILASRNMICRLLVRGKSCIISCFLGINIPFMNKGAFHINWFATMATTDQNWRMEELTALIWKG